MNISFLMVSGTDCPNAGTRAKIKKKKKQQKGTWAKIKKTPKNKTNKKPKD